MAEYNIEGDLDVNHFESEDFRDLTNSAIGTGFRETTINFPLIIASLIILFFVTTIAGLFILFIKK